MMRPFVLDRALVLERLGGDEDILVMMLGILCDDAVATCDELDAALASGDLAVLRRVAHTLKGSLASVSDEEGAALAYQLELQAKSGAVVDGAAQVKVLQARLRDVVAVLAANLPGR